MEGNLNLGMHEDRNDGHTLHCVSFVSGVFVVASVVVGWQQEIDSLLVFGTMPLCPFEPASLSSPALVEWRAFSASVSKIKTSFRTAHKFPAVEFFELCEVDKAFLGQVLVRVR